MLNLTSIFSRNITVTIRNQPPSQLVRLNLTDNLSKIRKELETKNVINDTLLFSKRTEIDNNSDDSNEFSEIAPANEKDFVLSDIIDENGNILHLKCSRPDWKVLKDLRKLEFGCTMTFNGIEKAKKRAFVMNDCKLDEFGAEGCQIGNVEFNSIEDRFMKTNLFFNTDINVGDFVKLGMSVGTSKNENFRSETDTSYRYTMYRKMSLKFREYLKPSPEFIEAVNNAINSKDPENFQQITEEFGQFIPTEVVMGGKAYLDDIKTLMKHSTEVNNDVTAEVLNANLAYTFNDSKERSGTCKIKCQKLIGGEQPDSLENFDEKAWIKSLKDYRNWNSIEFRDPVSIFQLLPDNLRKQIIEFVGKIIHHLEIENFDCQLEEVGKPIIFELKKLPLKVSKMFQNKDADCNIFATVNDKAGLKNDFFTCQILCPPDGKPKPSLIIHCIQKRLNKRKYKLEIGWMVIGYCTDLNFISSNFNAQLNILKNGFDTQDMSKAELLSFKDNPPIKRFPLGISVLSKLDSSNNSLVIGHHFFDAQETNKIGLYTFSYCLKKQQYVELPKFNFHTLMSNYSISDAFKTISFIRRSYSSCTNTKYLSLFSTKKTNFGPIFLKQKGGQIKIKYINCKQRNCSVCKSKISEENIKCVYLIPDKSGVDQYFR